MLVPSQKAGAIGAPSVGVGTGLFPSSEMADAVRDYSASGIYIPTSTVGTTSAGSFTIYLADVSTFKISQGISIIGAGTSGLDHTTTIASVNTTSGYVVLNSATMSTVLTGAIVYHDDTVALQSWLTDSILIPKYLPQGNYIKTAKLHNIAKHSQIFGIGVFGMTMGYYTLQIDDITKDGIGSTIFDRHDGDSLYIDSSNISLTGLNFEQHPTVPVTTGTAIQVGPTLNSTSLYQGSTAGVYNLVTAIRLDKIVSKNKKSALTISQAWGVRVNGFNGFGCIDYGIIHNGPIPFGGHLFHDITLIGNYVIAADFSRLTNCVSKSAIYIPKSDWNNWSQVSTFGFKYGIEIDTSAGYKAGQQTMNGVNIDGVTTGGYGIYMHGTYGNNYASMITNGFINYGSYNGAGSIYLDAYTKNNIIRDIVVAGSSTGITDLGVGNDVAGIKLNF